MQEPSTPLPVFRQRSEVQVYIGAGWAKGTVTESSRNRCAVHLGGQQRTVVVSDARNIRGL